MIAPFWPLNVVTPSFATVTPPPKDETVIPVPEETDVTGTVAENVI